MIRPKLRFQIMGGLLQEFRRSGTSAPRQCLPEPLARQSQFPQIIGRFLPNSDRFPQRGACQLVLPQMHRRIAQDHERMSQVRLALGSECSQPRHGGL